MARKVNVIPKEGEPVQEEPAQEEEEEAPEAQDEADEINTEDLEFLIAETQERKGRKETPKKAHPKAECPDCGKTMSAKALKYSHAPNCKAKPLPPPPPEPTPEPAKKTRAPRKLPKEEPPPTQTLEPQTPKPQTRQEVRKQRFSSLASQAF